MRALVAVVTFATSAALGGLAVAQDAFVATEEAREAVSGLQPQARTSNHLDVYTAWGHDFELFLGTEGPVNSNTGSRPCAVGPCGWAAGLHLPTGAQIRSVEFSACDDDATQQLVFFLLRAPKDPSPAPTVFLVPPTGTGIAATPGCTTFTATLTNPETVVNKDYSYVFLVNSNPGTNLEWNQYRAVYSLH